MAPVASVQGRQIPTVFLWIYLPFQVLVWLFALKLQCSDGCQKDVDFSVYPSCSCYKDGNDDF